MTQQSARVTVDVHACWLPEVPAPEYPGPITEPMPVVPPPPVPALPNPPLPYPDTSGLPDPEIIPGDYCSKLIYNWLIHVNQPTPTAAALLASVIPDAFDTLDTSSYDAELAALIDEYNAAVDDVLAEHSEKIQERQSKIDEMESDRQAMIDDLEAERQELINDLDADYAQDVLQREEDIADCEAGRYPDPPESGMRVRVSTRGASTSGGYNSSRAGLRTTCRLRLGAGTH